MNEYGWEVVWMTLRHIIINEKSILEVLDKKRTDGFEKFLNE